MAGKRRYSGPLMRGQKSVKRRATKGGLNKVEKKQAVSIAKKVFNKKVESKYFKTQASDSLNEAQPVNIQTGANMTCLGYCTGNRTNAQTGSIWNYGTAQMQTLNLNRPYITNDGAPLDQFVIDGLYCSPQFAQSRWILERIRNDFSNQDVPPERALSYYVRILRVMPRTQKTSAEVVDPTNDVFFDTNGQATGISVSGFTKLQLMTLKPNTRKYKVIQDIKYMMNSPMTTNALDIGDGANQVFPEHAGIMRTFNFRHDIGKKLYYNSPDPDAGGNVYPSSGFKNEFVLFHFQTLGDDQNFALRSVAKSVRVSCNAVSTFKDA